MRAISAKFELSGTIHVPVGGKERRNAEGFDIARLPGTLEDRE